MFFLEHTPEKLNSGKSHDIPWNQHFISYKMVPILITFEKVVEILYCVNLIKDLK